MENLVNFAQDLPLGKKGELEFYQRYKTELNLTKIEGTHEDFLCHGIKTELKSEQRHFGETGNIFLETVRNDNTGNPGGIIQAVKEHQAELFISWFPKDNIYFIYDAVDLMNNISKITRGKRLIPVNNSSYSSLGYAIDALELLPYCEKTNITAEEMKKLKREFQLKINKAKAYSLFQLVRA